MSILRFSTLSLTLAIAVFALGYVSPSFADKPDDKGNHGQHDGDDGTESFSVDMVAGSDDGNDNWVVATGACAGTTSKNLSASFPVPCGTTITVQYISPPGPSGSVVLRLFALDVRTKKQDALLFFTSNTTVSPAVEGASVFHTKDRLKWTFESVSPTKIMIEVNKRDVTLIKEHEPDKRALLDSIDVGNIVYTPE